MTSRAGGGTSGQAVGWIARVFTRRRAPSHARESENKVDPAALAVALEAATAQTGASLAELTRERPRLVVFLRHLGCTFCRETLAELARQRQAIERQGAGIVLVHLARDDRRAERLFRHYKLADVPRVADPERHLYHAVGLERGSLGELLGPHVLARTVEATCRGHLPGRTGGDTRQMPGVFLIQEGRIVVAFRHRTAADRPDYEALAGRAVAGEA